MAWYYRIYQYNIIFINIYIFILFIQIMSLVDNTIIFDDSEFNKDILNKKYDVNNAYSVGVRVSQYSPVKRM